MSRWVLSAMLAGLLAIGGATGCGRGDGGGGGESGDRTLTFRFKTANGLHVGAKVKALGTTVGMVAKDPEIAPDGKSVLISATLDGLSADQLSLLTRRMTARIEKDNLVAGEGILTLYFCEKPAPRLPAGEILSGCDSFVELEAWKLLCTGPVGVSTLDRLMGLVLETDPLKIGTGIYWLNVAAFCSAILLIMAMLLDLVLRVMQGRQRTRPSPYVLVIFWQVFVLVSALKVTVLAVALVAWAGGFALPDLTPWFVMPDNAVKLVIWDWRFLAIIFTLAGIRIKLGLLCAAVKKVL